jgi:hypothetical protein
MIFFHDKHWYRSEPLFSVEEQEEEDEDEEEPVGKDGVAADTQRRSPSPTPSQETVKSAPASSVSKKPEYEFLLFNYLLRFAHREGQIGDFARAGLLFLMDVAMSPGEPIHRLAGDDSRGSSSSISETAPSDPITDAALALAEYILDGDFSEVLGAGLGAVYSLLPSKLEFRPKVTTDAASGNGMVIGGTGPETEEEKEKLEASREKSHALGLEDASNPDFKSRLDHFLKLLEFLQDVLRRNIIHEAAESSLDASMLVGTAIVQSILDAVRRIFLENVLYPTVLECSDADGSAVAVMSYIEMMIRTLEQGQLSDLLISFLINEDNEEVARPRPRHPSMLTLGDNPPPRSKSGALTDKHHKLRRRKSSAMALLEMEAPESRRPSEYFTSMGRFTLKDLLMSNLRSKNQPTAAAALQLLQSMLQRHCQLCVDRLLVVFHDPKATCFPEPAMLPPPVETKVVSLDGDDDDEEKFIYLGAEDDELIISTPSGPVFTQPDTTYSTHEREMGLYLTLVSRVDPSHNEDAFSTGYDHYLRDALFSIQNQPCFYLTGDAESRSKSKHRLNANDPILTLVLDSLRKFFFNAPEFNIALTGVLATLAICPDRSLAGWLTFATNDANPANELEQDHEALNVDDDGDDRSIDFRIEEKLANESNLLPASSVDEHSRPVVHTIFHGLVAQLEQYRQLVNNFDRFLLERRQGLLFSENLTDALSLALDIANEPPKSPAASFFASPPQTPAQPVKPKAKPTATSSFVSFLTPKKNKPTPSKVIQSTPEPSTPSRGANKTIAASPFGAHYQQTRDIMVEPFVASTVSSGPWTPAKSSKWVPDDEDPFGNQWGEQQSPKQGDEDDGGPGQAGKTDNVTLSQLLDNVVILEESIKELVAIIHARRSLGIDSVRYF